ncbi:MAG: tyrosine-type recombinase/integrase [Ilumatobacteraceae bacterium]|jgi:integrase
MSAEALRVLEGGRAPRGWEELWAKDVWRQDELPHGDLASTYRGSVYLHFEHLRQPWLKEAAKRWVRARLLGDTTPRTMSEYLSDLRHFSQWLDEHAPQVTSPALLTREVLENFLLWLRVDADWKPATRQRRVISLRNLLDEQSEDGLAGLPRGATIHGAEVPRVDYRLPKELGDDIFGQWVDPQNLVLLESEQHRTIVLLLAHTGFRVSSLITLPRDTLRIGPDGHPYLRYWNIKSKREAMLPVPPQLAAQLERHEAHLCEHYPDGTEWLLPSPPPSRRGMSRGGEHHITHSTVRRVVKGYVRRAEIRTRDGRLALDIHPHLFRHHLGTSMVNDNVPLPVIQKILDHGSLEMTGHYARLHDETLKREVLRWHERVNRRGERIALPIDGPLEEATWMKERIARAKQALPNGYCGLPLVQTCPHPNACLSCDSFLTDGSFRDIHEQQRAQTRNLLGRAQDNNNVRLIEVLQRDEASLTRILEALDAIDADHSDDAAVDLRDLATPTTQEIA